MTGTTVAQGPVRAVLHPLVAGDTWRRTLHAVVGLATGVAWFTILVTMLSLGGGLLVTLVGFPILWLTALIARDLIAPLERAWASWALGVRVSAPPRRPAGGTGLISRMFAPLADPSTWRATLYGLLQLPVGVLTFTVTVTVWATGLGLLTVPAWGTIDGVDVMWDGNTVDAWWEWVGLPVAGALLVLAAPWVVRGVTEISAVMVRGLLGARAADLQAENARLAAGRDLAVDAAAAERRRIERDLHDGAQARLTALSMELGQARERLEEAGDPATATLVASAHEQAKQAMAELRGLVRGVAPAILADRGLDAALSSLAAASAVPVHLDVRLARRLPDRVESAAYFTAAEALANAGRHAGATRIDVQVRDAGDRLELTVTDDGRGGAAPRPGGGLEGLAGRLAAVDGTLRLQSPAGGPTRVIADIPCA